MKQRGSAMVVGLSVLAAFIALILTVVVMLVNAANYGNRTEVEIKKVWQNNTNILGQMTLKIREIASVPEMYRDDLEKVMKSVMTARMGKDGSKALFQWFNEQNIPYDSSMYTKIQQTIEASRNEFQTAQTRLIDVKATYETSLGSIPQGWLLSIVGYPKIDLDKYRPIVAEDTQQIFDRGYQAPIKLR